MNAPTKATGAAAMLATAVIATLSWLLDLYGIKIPEIVTTAWTGALAFGFGYLIHTDPPTS